MTFFDFIFAAASFARSLPAPPWDLTVMNEGRTVFAQLMDQLPKYELDKCIARYDGNRRMRSFSTYEQFLTMAFAQLTYRESLRDITTCLHAVGPKL